MTTRLAILGATGSIGRQALEIARLHPDRLQVVALAADRRRTELAALATEFGARALVGTAGLRESATAGDVDLVLVATPGFAGVEATLAALGAGKDVALANKEVLVVAGHLVRALAGGAGKRLRPVDSEHHALWQCLEGVEPRHVRRVALTASGGAFRDREPVELASVSAEEALQHPTWTMGPKVTIDSATLVNKGYEVVETRWLYDLPYDRIDVVLHHESVVHALVELADGSVKAQLAEPDMRLPIQYALLWDRAECPAPRFDWEQVRSLRLGPVDPARYPCFAIVLETARSGDLAAMVGLSAADEVAVDAFLRNEIAFTAIPGMLRHGAELGAHEGRGQAPELAEIVAIDRAVRESLTLPAAAASR